MSENKIEVRVYFALCHEVMIYRTLKPNGTKELFRQHRIGLDKAKAREELSDNTGDDDKFLYEFCEKVETDAGP